MDCLVDYIGLKSVTLNPGSGLFINSLPGMSTELASNIATDEQVDAAGLWADVQSRSFLRLSTDVVNLLSEDAKLNQVIFQTRRPTVYRNQATITSSAKYRGVVVQVPESRFVTFYFKEVYVYSRDTIQTVLKVIDLNDDTEALSKTIDLTPGLNVISVDQIFPLRFGAINLFIGVDSTSFNTISFYPEYFNFYDCGNLCAQMQSNFGHQPYYLVIQPAENLIALPINFDNIIKHFDGQGVAIGAEIQCSAEEFICQNKKSFDQSLLYLLGSEMLFEKQGSSRLNFFSSTNLEQTNAFRLEFESRYLSNLKRTLKSIPLNGESLCFDCDEPAFISYKNADL